MMEIKEGTSRELASKAESLSIIVNNYALEMAANVNLLKLKVDAMAAYLPDNDRRPYEHAQKLADFILADSYGLFECADDLETLHAHLAKRACEEERKKNRKTGEVKPEEKPERNCDHYKTVAEAVKAYWAFCTAHYQYKDHSCGTCPFQNGPCLARFFYAEYKPEVKQ
jgi:UDP-N-acetylglucosamine 2-epimerase